MKKVATLILAVCLMFTATVAAKEDGDIKAVLSQVKERIPATDGYANFESSTREYLGRKTYSFYWSTEDYASTLNVEVTTDGVITEYYQYDDSDWKTSSPTINKKTRAEVLPAAQKLVDDLNPSLAGRLVVYTENEVEPLYAGNYSFSVKHMEGGIPVYGETGSVSLAPDGETLRSFWLNYSRPYTYPEASKAMSKEEAQKAFAEHIGMELSYQTRYEERSKSVYLSYQPKAVYGTYIDALTGEAVDFREMSINGKYAGAEDAAMGMKMDFSSAREGSFSKAEQGEFDKLEGLIGQEAAEAIVRASAAFAMPEAAKLSSISCARDYYNENAYYYHLQFNKDDGDDEYYYASASVDAVTGDILSFYQNEPYSREKNFTEEEVRAIGKAAALALCPGHVGEDGDYRLEEGTGNSLTYTRYIHDVPYREDAVSVTVNYASGKVTEYRFNYSDLAFPEPSGILTEEEAAKALFEQTDYVLSYYPVKSSPDAAEADTTRLAYILEDGRHELDAFTGKPVNTGSEKAAIPSYTDIEGHWAEEAIKTLAAYGIGFEEEAFRPDDIIKQKEFLSLLISVVQDRGGVVLREDIDTSWIYRWAMNRGIIDPIDKDEDAAVTRSDAAVYMIRAMELEEAAKLEDIFNCPYTDVTEKKGYITILTGMKVLSGNGNGTFMPKEAVTRAAAMMMIYNYLAR